MSFRLWREFNKLPFASVNAGVARESDGDGRLDGGGNLGVGVILRHPRPAQDKQIIGGEIDGIKPQCRVIARMGPPAGLVFEVVRHVHNDVVIDVSYVGDR